MALKTLMLKRKLDEKKKLLEAVREKQEQLQTREAELEQAINEAETEEEQQAVEEEVGKFEEEKAENEAERTGLEKDIADLEAEIAEEERKQQEATQTREKENKVMDEKEIRAAERKAFERYVRETAGVVMRDDDPPTDYNMTQGNNGYIVPKSIAEEVITKVKNICPIFERAQRYDVKGNLDVPFYPASSEHVIAAAYASEMEELVASSGDFGKVSLTGFLAGALAKISKKLVNNTEIDVVPFVTDQMAVAFAEFYEHECLIGTDGKATGLLAGIAAVNTVTAAAKSSIKADELIDCQDKVPDALQKNAIWIMHSATRTALRKLKDGDNRYLLQDDITAPFGSTLLGKPVFVSDNMPQMGTTNNKAVVYGDMTALGVKVTEDLEIQVLVEKFATQHAVGVVGWTEIDTKVVNEQKVSCIKMGSSDPQ